MDNKNSIVKFEDTELQISINKDYEIEMDMEELSKAIGLENKKGIEKIIENHSELKNREFSYLKKVLNEEGGILKKREKRIFNEQGIYEVAMLANTQRAKEFRRFVRNFMTKFRRNELIIGTGGAVNNIKKLDEIKEILVKRDDELEKLFDFIDLAKNSFEKIDVLTKEITEIKKEIKLLKLEIKDLTDDFYGDDEGGEE